MMMMVDAGCECVIPPLAQQFSAACNIHIIDIIVSKQVLIEICHVMYQEIEILTLKTWAWQQCGSDLRSESFN